MSEETTGKNMDEQVEDKFGTDADLLEDQDAANSDLAAEALADTEEAEKSSKPAEESEDRPSVETVSKLREQRREEREGRHRAELEAAELKGRLSAQEDRQSTEQELSPVAAELKKQGVATEDELELSTGETMRLMRQETKWDAAREAKTTAATAETDRTKVLSGQFQAAAKVDRGEGLDYDTIVKAGETLLTKGEKLDIENSKEPYELAYSLCLRATQDRGDESTKKTLQERLARKTEKTVKDKPDKPDKPDEDETDDEEVSETIVNPRLAALAEATVTGGSNAE